MNARLVALLALLTGCAASRPDAVQPKPEAPPPVIEVAITVDDLPQHGPLVPGREPASLARALLDAFARHRVPRVYGFLNGARLEARPEDRAVLEAWVAAGHPLGNHQWAHQDLNAVASADFIEGIRRNEPLLAALQPQAPARDWKVFRYPYLREGLELAERDRVRAHLVREGYRIAHVTVDPYDWAYNVPYARCLAQGAAPTLEALRRQFLAEARAKLRAAVATSRALLGRPIPHVLLLHLGAVDADAVEQLLSDYERLGVRWVPLERVLEDPAYAEDPHVPYGGVFHFQLAEARGVSLPPPPLTPTHLLEVTCPAEGGPAGARP
jgi:peptidoglycan/xylan/chitin deacetylase (PgdA/CDA1 family)